MDDNYFDKKLKGILESPPDFQPDSNALNDMQSRLRASKQPIKKNRRLLFLLLPLLLLPFLLGGYVFYQKYDHLNEKIVELNKQIVQINQRDTIVEKQIIHHYDTIYNVIYRETYIREQSPKTRTSFSSGWYSPGFYSRPFYSPYSTTSQGYSLHTSTLNPSTPFYTLVDQTAFRNSPFPSTKNQSSAYLFNQKTRINLNALKQPIFESGQQKIITTLKDEFPEYNDGKVPMSYHFTPSGFGVGGSFSPWVFANNDYNSKGNAFGINARIEFPGDRSLNIGFEILSQSFEVKEESLFSNFPIETPTDPTDVLHELKVNFTYLQIPVTLRQKLFEIGHFQTYVNAGIVAYKPLATDFKYEYINSSGEYKLNSSFKEGAFSADNMRLGIETDYALGKHFSANAGVIYQHGFSLNESEYFPLRFWAVNLGMHYRL